MMSQLIQEMFISAFDNPLLKQGHDSALIDLPQNRIALTTDSYVINPLFFPGGDIASLAIYGTVNDLAMAGARPLYLSVGFILEEGLCMETLWNLILSMREAAERCQVKIVTGDTKVVNRGKGDGIYINTSGVGLLETKHSICPQSIQEGDVILLSGDLGRHGVAVMAFREGLEFETKLQSDLAPLHDLVKCLMDSGVVIHCMRDLTRGGLGSALIELAETSKFFFEIEEKSIPLCEDVEAACEILGLDPLFVANEGRFVLFVSPQDQEKALNILRSHPLGENAVKIGEVKSQLIAPVILKSKIGVARILDFISGEQLPRIC
ncbi:MAG: hydrogenase expression/formation protein HypE [Deltaproteobacteria bacterium]|nr:hydrogenase expression/formation protein HypE [Deltaproteobacteria bacterium]